MKRHIPILFVMACALGRCATPCQAAMSGVENHVVSTAQPVESIYPQSFRAQHRITLSIHGQQVDFTGYLLVKQPGTWRALALGEFGSTLFDIISVPQKGRFVVQKPGKIKKRWLTGFAADIIEILYLPSACMPQVDLGSGEAKPQVCNGKTGVVYMVEYLDFVSFPGVSGNIPRHIVVANDKYNFRLDAELIKLETVDNPATLFTYERH